MPAPTHSLRIVSPDEPAPQSFSDPAAAVARLEELYTEACDFLAETFSQHANAPVAPGTRFRAYYPEVRLRTASHAQTDSRLSFGYVAGPGSYSATVTRPDLFRNYLTQQIALVIQNHGA